MRGTGQVGAEEEEARSRPEDHAALASNSRMVVGPPTVTRTSETRPAATTASAAGPRWTSASVELAAMGGGGGGGGGLWVQVRREKCTRAEHPRSDGGKGVGEGGSERAEVDTSMTVAAAGGDEGHQRTRHHAT